MSKTKKSYLPKSETVLSFVAFVVSWFAYCHTTKHDNLELNINQRPYLFAVEYKSPNYSGKQIYQPEIISLRCVSFPAIILEYKITISTSNGKIFDTLTTPPNSQSVAYTNSEIEYNIPSTKLAKYIRSYDYGAGSEVALADQLYKINGWSRFVYIKYKSFNQNDNYIYSSTEIFDSSHWVTTNIETYKD